MLSKRNSDAVLSHPKPDVIRLPKRDHPSHVSCDPETIGSLEAQVLLSSLNRSFSETLQLKPADLHDPQMCELDPAYVL